FSPDGKLLAIRSQRRPGFESDRWYVDLYDQTTGAKRTLFETPDLSVDDFCFSNDGRSILFLAVDKGLANLYSIPVAGGTPKIVSKGGVISQFHPTADSVIFAKSTTIAPTEIFRTALDGSATKQLTNENADWLSQVDMPQPELMSVTGAA